MAIRPKPTTGTAASLGELFAQIDEFQDLGPNWDGENAMPIERKVVLRAKNLVQRISAEASLVGLRWESPSVAPNPDGALELSWEKDNRWVMLVLEPGHSKIACAKQENGAEPRYQSVSGDEAVQQVLWAMRA
jgi:hypothetical protein